MIQRCHPAVDGIDRVGNDGDDGRLARFRSFRRRPGKGGVLVVHAKSLYLGVLEVAHHVVGVQRTAARQRGVEDHLRQTGQLAGLIHAIDQRRAVSA